MFIYYNSDKRLAGYVCEKKISNIYEYMNLSHHCPLFSGHVLFFDPKIFVLADVLICRNVLFGSFLKAFAYLMALEFKNRFYNLPRKYIIMIYIYI